MMIDYDVPLNSSVLTEFNLSLLLAYAMLLISANKRKKRTSRVGKNEGTAGIEKGRAC